MIKNASARTKFRQLLWLGPAAFLLATQVAFGDAFYRGVDLSYVNQMEDCGVVFTDSGQAKSAYEIMTDRGANLVRVRLWHDPLAWSNFPSSYSSYTDVEEAIARARAQGASVLLNFHYSDTWADPGKQHIPSAWASLINNTPALADQVYSYTYQVLSDLAAQGLQPEFVQVGNETNGNILNNLGLFPINWNRQATLFNAAIDAIRDVDAANDARTRVVLHVANPAHGGWWVEDAKLNGILDFDVLGLSYYPQWHGSTVAAVAATVAQLRDTHNRNVMLLEVGAPWTSSGNDSASNILGSAVAGYPVSPQGQRDWLVDLADAVHAAGGLGIVYWEPAWVSSNCGTEWAAQGSHYENATFFDFNNALIEHGGVAFLAQTYPPVDAFTASVPDFGQQSGTVIQGQAFTPEENAEPNPGYPDGVFLEQLVFMQGANNSAVAGVSVDIYEPAGATLESATFIGKSTNTIDTVASSGTEYVFHFDRLPLEISTTYLAIFKDSNDQPVGLGLMQGWEGSPVVADYERGGAIFDYDQWGYSSDTNADFSAVFSTVVPAVRVPSLAGPGTLLLALCLASIAKARKARQGAGK